MRWRDLLEVGDVVQHVDSYGYMWMLLKAEGVRFTWMSLQDGTVSHSDAGDLAVGSQETRVYRGGLELDLSDA